MDQHPIQIAPMMDCTDRHFRYFIRLITKRAWLFTEMITAQAILHGNATQLLSYHPDEHPLTLQLGGSDPRLLATVTKIAMPYRYDEINLNVGCPSARVQSGSFGACLMAKPTLVATCIDAMQQATSMPVSIKIRTGIDNDDNYDFLQNFIGTIAETGCKRFIIHARKAWLSGLSPKQNREIPPLQYDRVYQVKRDFPHLNIIINGGIKSLEEAKTHLSHHLDGVMIGRAAYQNPYLLATVDQMFYNSPEMPLNRNTILERLVSYIEQEMTQGTLARHITRHILGLFHGIPDAKKWRRLLTGSEKDSLDFRQIFSQLCRLG